MPDVLASLLPQPFVHDRTITPLSHIFLQALLGFVIAMALVPLYLRLASRYQWWKQIKDTSITGEKASIFLQLHAEKHKRHIPTMGGIVMIVAIALVTLTLNLSRNQTYLPLAALIAAGVVGLFDDWLNISSTGGIAGMRSKIKLALIFGIGLVGGLYFYYKLGYNLIHIPAVGDFSIGWLYVPLFVLVVVSTANAVNITDGLDGLAGGLLATAFGCYAIIAYFQGSYGISAFCATVVGAMLTYTWFNVFPARFFMGDTGAIALGTTLGVVVMLTNSVFTLPIIGAVFVIETGSVIAQFLSKKLRHRKLFLLAPLHHHLEASGWPETKVTMRLWIVGQITGVIGTILGLLGNKLQ